MYLPFYIQALNVKGTLQPACEDYSQYWFIISGVYL